MTEYKGKRQYCIIMIIFGIILLAITICCLFLLIDAARILEAVIISVLFGIGSIGIFIVGLSNAIYSQKVVLKIYSDKIEFLNAGKLFNNKWITVTFSQIKEFRVTKNGYIVYKKKPKYVNLKSGHIHFIFDGGYCWVDLKDCLTAGKVIITNLDDSQISKDSELQKHN